MICIKHFENGNAGLVAKCDVCGEEVTGDSANVCWTEPKNITLPHQMFTIACKDQCTRKLDMIRGKHQSTIELDTAISYLVTNAKIDMKEANFKAELLSIDLL